MRAGRTARGARPSRASVARPRQPGAGARQRLAEVAGRAARALPRSDHLDPAQDQLEVVLRVLVRRVCPDRRLERLGRATVADARRPTRCRPWRQGCRAGCRPATPAPAIRSRARPRAPARRGRGSAPSAARRRTPPAPPSRRRTPARRRARRGRHGARAQRGRDPPGATCRASQRAATGCAANRASPRSTPPCQARKSCASASATSPSSERAGAERRSARCSRRPPAQRLGQEQEAAEPESGQHRERDELGRRCPRRCSPARTGSAACSNDPFPVTNRRMNAASSGDGVEADDVQRNARAPIGDRGLADAVDVAAVVVEVADE